MTAPGDLPVDVRLVVRFPVDDQALSDLHAKAFGSSGHGPQPWSARLQRHSLTWVGAYCGDTLIGFVHACWDGGLHAFLLDTVVHPDHQRRGIAGALVNLLVDQVTAAGCEWLHVDYEPHVVAFYEQACGFRPSHAGLLRLPLG